MGIPSAEALTGWQIPQAMGYLTAGKAAASSAMGPLPGSEGPYHGLGSLFSLG